MTREYFDVVGVGFCNVDYMGIVPEYPALDQKMQLLEFSIQGGGPTATAMATVGRLGGTASYIGKVGDDDFGRFILDDLARDGVDTSGVVVQGQSSSQFSFVVVDRDTGKRTIFWTPSSLHLGPDEIAKESIVRAKVLHVDAHHPGAALLAATWANEAGIPVLMDAGSMRPGSAEIMERTDVLVASTLFARQYTGTDDPEQAAAAMYTGRRRLSAVTVGDCGCYYATEAGVFHQPAFGVDVVDTTGAGDVFHGAFSYGLSQGWDFDTIVRFASAVAAMKCTRLGGRAGIPTLEQVSDFLRSHT